jgi:hypothetical protein
MKALSAICATSGAQGRRLTDTPHRSGEWVALLNVEEGEVITFLLRQADPLHWRVQYDEWHDH